MKAPVIFISSLLVWGFSQAQNGVLVLQTDFGVKDGAVAAMKGVAMKVSANLKIFDLTHEIPAFNIWEAAYRLEQTSVYWPEGTVFVSVVDPGVGSERKSIVAKTKSGHYFVTPDNGTLTLVAKSLGIEAVRIIDEKINRLKRSGRSNTFHGRDVFAYTAARLASRIISFQQVGPELTAAMVMIPYQVPFLKNGILTGGIPILDTQYGNVWTNIPDTLLKQLNISFGDSLNVDIFQNSVLKFNGIIPFVKTFSGVSEKADLCYLNSLLNLALATNQGNFAKAHGIKSGPGWTIEVSKKSRHP